MDNIAFSKDQVGDPRCHQCKRQSNIKARIDPLNWTEGELVWTLQELRSEAGEREAEWRLTGGVGREAGFGSGCRNFPG